MTPLLFLVSTLFLVTGAMRNSSYLHRQTRQQRQCTYTHQFRNVGEWINLRSEGYPNTYYPNLDCRYTISSPKGTVLRLECPEFNLEYGSNCPYDKFFWSRSGDPSFRDWRFACGTTPIKDTSLSNVLTVGFISDADNNPAGNYYFGCKITVDPAACSAPCGLSGVTNRIVNGVDAQVAEFPHRGAMSIEGAMFCACTLINEWYAMTAAHCLKELGPGERVSINFGDHDLRTNAEANNITVEVASYTIHPGYNSTSTDKDIALMRFTQPVQFRRNISPICLPWKYATYDLGGATCTASGWGTLGFAGPLSKVLKKIDVETFNSQTCNQMYKGSIEITENMICAGGREKDTCQADSGGSLDFWDSALKRFYSLGIVSFGPTCAEWGKPGIYTDVTKFLGWIEQVTQAVFCKI